MNFDPTKHVRVRRSAKADTVDGNLVRVSNPVAITLTNRPANERPFQVVRSDEEGTVAAPVKRVMRKVQRNDSPVLALTFPEGYTEEQVAATLDTFEMSHYVVEVDAAGIYTAKRSDLQSIAELATTDIKLNTEGVIARLDAAQYTVQRSDNKDNIALVAFEFDAKRFDADAISSWIAQNNVDTAQPAVENATSNSFTVKRSEVAEGTDTRRVQVEEGVTAVIVRAETADVPAAFAIVNEAAYGNYGWGHLDFYASMADEAFCELMDDAGYRLRRVLGNVILHSQLPLESRKALVDRTLAQYGEFVKNVIDALPRQVMQLVTRAAEPKESNAMKIEGQETPAAATPAAASPETFTLTRAEIDAQIAAGVEAELARRAEAAPAAATETPAAAPAASAEAPVERNDATQTAAPAAITRADVEAAVANATADLRAKLDEMANTVVLRSDAGDQKVAVTPPTNVKRSAEDVFAGSFSFPGVGAK